MGYRSLEDRFRGLVDAKYTVMIDRLYLDWLYNGIDRERTVLIKTFGLVYIDYICSAREFRSTVR